MIKKDIIIEKLKDFITYWPIYKDKNGCLEDIEKLIDELENGEICSDKCNGKMIFMEEDGEKEIFKCYLCGRQKNRGYN